MDDDDDYWEPPAEGSALRVMWDETAGPMWGDEGLLPEEPEWLRTALGLTESVVTALGNWMSDMTAFRFGPRTEDWQARQQQLNERGDELAKRVQEEVGPRYRVRYHR